MKISKLIKILKLFEKDHGDLQVKLYDDTLDLGYWSEKDIEEVEVVEQSQYQPTRLIIR